MVSHLNDVFPQGCEMRSQSLRERNLRTVSTLGFEEQ